MTKITRLRDKWTPNDWMHMAIRLANQCPADDTAYSVGCVIVDPATNELVSSGFSREDGARGHAEQIALRKAAEEGRDVTGFDLYTTMEPCSARDSDPQNPCADLTIRARIGRVFQAVAEPPNFKHCVGADKLHQAGIKVVYMPEFSALALRPNAHIVKPLTAQKPRRHGHP